MIISLYPIPTPHVRPEETHVVGTMAWTRDEAPALWSLVVGESTMAP